ncbi:MAG: hypothetical protein J6Y92_04430, partial [Lentisphaeria bacterium]|nr:hypothetical protein [Lentisphaeria bacterium]
MDYEVSSGVTESGIILENISMTVLDGGENVYFGDDGYTLTLTDDVLTVANNSPTVTNENGDVLLEGVMPQARYMYGCVNTSISMILGYYDLYGYRGKDFSALIEGDVELDSRGTGYYIYMMDDFDSNLGKANATRDYVERFFSKDPINVINARTETETTPAEELPYSFVDDGAGTELRTDVWNCLADYLGTGQFWRGNPNLNADSPFDMLEVIMNDNEPFTVTDEATGIQRTIEHKYTSCLYGLYLYVRDKGYDLDRKTTKLYQVDVDGGVFTFDDYRKEIDAGRPVMVLVKGHAMVGYGYNAETREIIIDNCYEAGERMVWDGTYDYAGERPLEAICTVGLMPADVDIDLAVSPFDEDSGVTGKLIVSTAEGPQESLDYCFVGSPLYLSLAVSNLGTTASGVFDVMIYCDDEEKEKLSSLSLDPGSIRRVYDIQLATDFGVGLHSIGVRIDPGNEIQETAALNNFEERSLMVLKDGTNVVEGTKTVASGEVSSDDYVMNGAGIQVLEGGTAEATLIQGKITSRSLDGKKVETEPGYVNVSRGGLIRNADVYEYGLLDLSGTAEDIRVQEDGKARVLDGGIVSGASVDKEGILEVESGGKLTGETRLEDGAKVSFEEGSILNFDLTGTTAGAEALVNDLSIIQGTPTFTLMVDDSRKSGTYSLAEGAAGFEGTITVQNTSGEFFGTLTVGGKKVFVDKTGYTLNLADSLLSVTVDPPDETAPVITLTADTETVVLQTTLTATVDDGSTIQYRIGEFGLWKEYKEPIIASLNETYYFMAADEAGNIGTNQITFTNIDTSGVLLSTLWSQKGINPMGDNTTIMYNEYTPLDSSVTPEAHCLTGCVNTASGQLIYYFIEKGWLDLPLTLEEKDEYTSKHKATTEGGDAIVIPVKSDGSTPGTLSFAEINAM